MIEELENYEDEYAFICPNCGRVVYLDKDIIDLETTEKIAEGETVELECDCCFAPVQCKLYD